MKNLYIYIICGGIVLFYFLLIQIRRFRFKLLAKDLGGKYFSQGLFKAGWIEGEIKTKKYLMLTDVKSSCIFIPFEYSGIPIGITSGFFDNYPNWRCATTVGNKEMRCFVKNIKFNNVVLPFPDEFKSNVLEIFSQVRPTLSPLRKSINKGKLWVMRNGAQFQYPGLTFNYERIRRILEYTAITANIIDKHQIGSCAEHSA